MSKLLLLLLFLNSFLISIPSTAQGLFAETSSKINWYSLPDALNEASQSDKLIMVIVYLDDCPYCQMLDQKVLTRHYVKNQIRKYFYPVKLSMSNEGDFVINRQIMSITELLENWHVVGTPTTVFLNKDFKVVALQPGYIDSKTFERLLRYIGTGAYATREFESYH